MKGKLLGLAALLVILSLIVVSSPLVNICSVSAIPDADIDTVTSASFPAGISLCGYEITDISTTYDGGIYAIADNDIYRISAADCDFFKCSLPAGFTTPPLSLTAAPDDSDVIAVSDSSADEVVWLSTNGGTTWANLGSPCVGDDTLTDINFSPSVSHTFLGRYLFATISDNLYSTVDKGNIMAIGGTDAWTAVGDVAGTHDYVTVEASPNFASDWCICAIGATAEPNPLAVPTAIDYQIISINSNYVYRTVEIVPFGTTTDFQFPPAYNSIIYADIALPVDFDPSDPVCENAFISLASFTLQSTDDVYRVSYRTAARLNVSAGNGIAIRSIDYPHSVGDYSLIAGEHANTRVWYTADPWSVAPSWTSTSTTPPGTKDAVVAIPYSFADNDTYYVGTSGPGSGLFLTDDNGITFACSCSPESSMFLNVILHSQETGMWCWAASAQMVMDYLGHNVSQCVQANNRFGRDDCCNIDLCPPPVEPNCNTPGGHPCACGGWPEFGKYEFSFKRTASAALSWDELRRQISDGPCCLNRPFAFTWAWPGGSGHVMVANGYRIVDDVKYVDMIDPWSPCVGGTALITYDYYVSSAGHHTHWDDFYDVIYVGP